MSISSISSSPNLSLPSNTLGNGQTLTPAQQQQVKELKARDQKVHQHEQAHMAAAGGLATSGANYSYQLGPDGNRYAIGGEVSIDTSPGSTPQQTVARARQIQQAALAPADPSPQDRNIAAAAARMAAEALQAEQSQTRTQKTAGATSEPQATIGSQVDTFA